MISAQEYESTLSSGRDSTSGWRMCSSTLVGPPPVHTAAHCIRGPATAAMRVIPCRKRLTGAGEPVLLAIHITARGSSVCRSRSPIR